MFERFTQLGTSRTKKQEGSGLGLYISKELVHLMGGAIRVESELKKGSTFIFTLPYETARREHSKSLGSVAHNTLENSKFHLLIAEDNPLNQKFILRILEKENYTVHVAMNGKEVVHLLDLDEYPYDLILMDIQMPEMDGIEATRQIRSRKDKFQNILIIAVTANSMENQIKEYYAAVS